jgi:hypothetical protein
VGSHSDPGDQASALAAAAGALAKAGQHEQAVTVARSIAYPDQRADALVTAAEALAAGGNTKKARYMASAACAVGRWTVLLRLVLSFEPSAIRVLTEL